MYLIGKTSEKWKHKQRQHIIHSHNTARNSIADVESVLENQRNNAVIQLPESADRQKSQTYQNSPFCVELHKNYLTLQVCLVLI